VGHQLFACSHYSSNSPCRFLAAVGPHPVVARLAAAALCGALEVCAPGPQERQLCAALAVLEELSACEALTGACRLDHRGPASRVASLLACMVQVRGARPLGAPQRPRPSVQHCSQPQPDPPPPLPRHAPLLQACGASPTAQQFVRQRLLAPPPQLPPADACAAAALAARVHAASLAQPPPSPEAAPFWAAALEGASGAARAAAQSLQQLGDGRGVERSLLQLQLGWLLEAARLAAERLQDDPGPDAPGTGPPARARRRSPLP
jgi:hypothetical protein